MNFDLFAQSDASILESVRGALTGLATSLQAFVPKLIGGFTIFIVGCLIASILRRVLLAVLTKIGLETMSERTGMKTMLSSIGLRVPLPVIISKTVFWVLMLMFLMTATQVVPGLESISKVLQDLVNYMPKAASAVLYGMIGLLVAQLVRGALLTSAESIGLDYAKPLSNLVYGFLAVVIVTLAIGQMEIETELLSKTIQISLGAVALALALAIGLGMQSVARLIAAGVYARDLFKPGMTVERDGEELSVVSVGATSTRLEGEGGRFVVIPNWDLLATEVKGRHVVPRAKGRN